MTVQRMDHVGVIVDDLAAAKEFFVALGLEVEGATRVEGDWVDRVVGLEGVRSELVMLRTPDGHARLELARFDNPPSPAGEGQAPPHAPGIRHVTFMVDDVGATIARLQSHGAELVGAVESYGNLNTCYIRGPEGIIVELAERIG